MTEGTVSKNIFVIMASAGEYSDRRVWAVSAFTVQKTAEYQVIHLTKLNKIKTNSMNPVDGFSVHETEYYIEEVELI